MLHVRGAGMLVWCTGTQLEAQAAESGKAGLAVGRLGFSSGVTAHCRCPCLPGLSALPKPDTQPICTHWVAPSVPWGPTNPLYCQPTLLSRHSMHPHEPHLASNPPEPTLPPCRCRRLCPVGSGSPGRVQQWAGLPGRGRRAGSTAGVHCRHRPHSRDRRCAAPSKAAAGAASGGCGRRGRSSDSTLSWRKAGAAQLHPPMFLHAALCVLVACEAQASKHVSLPGTCTQAKANN